MHHHIIMLIKDTNYMHYKLLILNSEQVLGNEIPNIHQNWIFFPHISLVLHLGILKCQRYPWDLIAFSTFKMTNYEIINVNQLLLFDP